eukprot:CAMPEP_0172490638 /NCGR_PEP_ID=MMETSP1066-20121228/21135_1 /TAXON_ID=671091 /ORGANISM="Coscinodiscus wailesii, Strain CCMP2513" /LENGTH=132 /DNA_ID=CAMNT_0013259211 /DNA_START=93 /DNA_END=492 /DNA_ORIENTATION=-
MAENVALRSIHTHVTRIFQSEKECSNYGEIPTREETQRKGGVGGDTILPPPIIAILVVPLLTESPSSSPVTKLAPGEGAPPTAVAVARQAYTHKPNHKNALHSPNSYSASATYPVFLPREDEHRKNSPPCAN